MIKKISVEEVRFHLQGNRVAVHLSHRSGKSAVGMMVHPIQGMFLHFICCWFGWSTELLGLPMENETNEQLSLRLSLPTEKTTTDSNLLVWRQLAQLNCKNKTLLFQSLKLSFHFPLWFHFLPGTWHLGNLLYLPQHLPYLPQSWSHLYSATVCFACLKPSCSPHLLPFVAFHPPRH